MLEAITSDFRHALRSLARSPRFAFTGVTVLGLGLGVLALSFALISAVLLRPLPYDRPAEIYQVLMERRTDSGTYETSRVEHAIVVAWKDGGASVDGVVTSNEARHETVFYLSGSTGVPQRALGSFVSPEFFDVLGVTPAAGHAFDAAGDAAEVVISYDLWVRAFGADPAVVGAGIDVNGAYFTVIGVTPPSFTAPPPLGGVAADDRVDVWAFDRSQPTPSEYDRVLVRVPGASAGVKTARAELARIAESALPGAGLAGVRLVPIADMVLGGVRPGLRLLAIIAVLTLLLVCANLGAIQLARFGARARESAIRSAIGAGPGRIFSHLLAEGLVLAVGGGLLAMGIVVWGQDLIRAVAPASIPRIGQVRVDFGVIVFTAIAALGAGFIATAWPAALLAGRAARAQPHRSTGATATRSQRRTRAVLVVAQIVIALALLTGTATLVRSVVNLLGTEPGVSAFDTQVMDIHRRRDAQGPVDAQQFYEQTLERVRNVPGVNAAALGSSVPFLARDYYGSAWRIRVVSEGYFETLGIALRAGRPFDTRDDAGSVPVAVISRALARQEFGDTDPVGAVLDDYVVIGVVADVRHESLDQAGEPALYLPMRQRPDTRLSLFVRTNGAGVQAIRESIHDIDPAQPIGEARSIRELLDRSDSVSRRRFLMQVVTTVALFAALLAALGIHGVVAQTVIERTGELGIRASLGASRAHTLRLVFRESAWLAAVGLAAGSVLAMVFTRLLANNLFEVRPFDPLLITGAALVLGLATVLACIGPALHATAIDPLTALRGE